MEFVNLTRHTGIGSNCYWLSVGGKNIILDAGSDPKVDGIGSTPDLRPLPWNSRCDYHHPCASGSHRLPACRDKTGATLPCFYDPSYGGHRHHHAPQFGECDDTPARGTRPNGVSPLHPPQRGSLRSELGPLRAPTTLQPHRRTIGKRRRGHVRVL